MIEKAAGIAERFRMRFLQKQPPKSIRLHLDITNNRTTPINPSLLSNEEGGQINAALEETGICSSWEELNKGVLAGDQLSAKVARFVMNDLQYRRLQLDGQSSLRMVIACGESGIYNALLAVGAVSLPTVLNLLQEKKTITEAQININQQAMTIVGADGPLQTITDLEKEIKREATCPYNEKLVNKALKNLGVFPPFEIGLDPKKEDRKRYFTIGAVLVGAAGVAAILTVVAHKRRQSRQKII